MGSDPQATQRREKRGHRVAIRLAESRSAEVVVAPEEDVWVDWWARGVNADSEVVPRVAEHFEAGEAHALGDDGD